MTGLAKRWVNEAGEIWEIEDPEYWARHFIVLKPIAGDMDRRCSVKREDLEDLRGWKPAPDHGAWRPISPELLLGDDERCAFGCGGCGARCTRCGVDNPHTRHYHPADMNNRPCAQRERDGYALERAKEGDWNPWLPPSLMPRVSPDDTLMRGGQVWACRSLHSDAAAVIRIHEVGMPVIIARRDVPGRDQGFFDGAPYACKAILVQQPDDPEPRLPSVLFAIPGPNDPIEPHPTAGLADDVYVSAMREMIKSAQRSLDADLMKVLAGSDIGTPIESAALEFENWRSLRIEADQDRLAAAIKRRLMTPPGNFSNLFQTPKKEATINGQRYSFASMEILIDGKPLKLDGIQSIDYKMPAPKPPSFFDIEMDARIPPDHWYLR